MVHLGHPVHLVRQVRQGFPEVLQGRVASLVLVGLLGVLPVVLPAVHRAVPLEVLLAVLRVALAVRGIRSGGA